MIVRKQRDNSWHAFQRIDGKPYVAEGKTRAGAWVAMALLLKDSGIFF